MADKKSSKKKGKSFGIGAAIWILIALFLFILFIANGKKIASNLKATGFFEKNNLKTPQFVENAEVPENSEKNDVQPMTSEQITQIDLTGNSQSKNASQNKMTESLQDDFADESQKEKISSEQSKTESEKTETAKTESNEKKSAETEKSESKKNTQNSESAKTETSANAQKEKSPVQTMNIRLYFMTINANGNVGRKEVTRVMKKSDGPLVDAINALIEGPNAEEENAGCRSLISNGTRLLGASVKNGIATLNFSGEFEFNQYGIEGTQGQLQQIVFTATAFPTVESVQFLVAGEKRNYLGSEGVWIGTPLSRNSF